MQLLHFAQEVAGFGLPVLAFATVRRKFHDFAVGEMEGLVDV